MTSLGEFLFPAPAPRQAWAIVTWWERRRLAYNVFVGAAGLVSLASFTVVGSFVEGSPLIPPWQPVVVFGVLANLCYLFGPLVELLVHTLWGRTVLPVGPSLYRIGLTFSVGLALLPTLLVAILATVRIALSLLG